jgi:cell division protein FtsL
MHYLPASLSSKRVLIYMGAASLAFLLIAPLFPPLYRKAVSSKESQQPVTLLNEYSGSSTTPKQSRLAGSFQAANVREVSAANSLAFSHKLVQTGSMDVLVKSPSETVEQIRQLTLKMGGYFENLQLTGQGASQTATITIRIPAARYEDAKVEIHKLAGRIETEKTDTTDVTKQYVDLEAGLHNLRAEEAQYFQIMKSAKKVPDMLQVTEKLSEVRGEIERQQAELATLSKQVDTVALNISLRTEQLATPTQIHWQPISDVKLAINDALDNLSSYVSAMISFAVELPVILLWLATIVTGAWAVWKLFRWVARSFFSWGNKMEPTSVS